MYTTLEHKVPQEVINHLDVERFPAYLDGLKRDMCAKVANHLFEKGIITVSPIDNVEGGGLIMEAKLHVYTTSQMDELNQNLHALYLVTQKENPEIAKCLKQVAVMLGFTQ